MTDTRRSIVRGAALALVLMALLGFAARQTDLLDRYFVFFPDREIHRTPGDVGLRYEDVFFTTSDGVRLHGWFIPSDGDTTLVWLHGNAGNISHRVDNLLMVNRMLGVNVLIVDYRGYGRSEGAPSEKGLYRDAEAALAYLSSRPQTADDRLVFFGRSLGAAVAVELATRVEPHALILESPFTSVREMAKLSYPFIPGPLLTLPVRSRFDSLAKIGGVQAPVMVLHGDMDDIVPIDIARRLYDAANVPKRFYTIEGAGHNDTYAVGGAAYFDALKAFIDDPRGGY